MTSITIKGTGRYLPERVVSNQEFTEFLDTSDEWIVSHTGIRERRVADEPGWHMGANAARKALDAAGMDAKDIDMIIVTTVTSDYAYPSTSCLIQREIGNTKAFCMDISVACAGFVYAVDMARRYLLTGGVEHVLIVSAEMLTQYTDYTDRASCILFGDGAGACVLTRGEGIYGAHLESDATGAHTIYAKRPRQQLPFFESAPSTAYDSFGPGQLGVTNMDGHDVYRWATRAMPNALHIAGEKAGISVEEMSLIIPHQANIRIIQTAAKQLKMPLEKFYINIDSYGNTSSASIPIALDECIRDGKLKRGDILALVGFGSGLVCGACVLRY